MGLVKLNERLAEPSLQEYFTGIFPTDSMANMRFSINFFTSIGLGGITDRQRELYKQVRAGVLQTALTLLWHCCQTSLQYELMKPVCRMACSIEVDNTFVTGYSVMH